MAVRRHPLPFMEDIMALERPSFSLELQYPHKPGHSSIWSEYGTYRSFDHAMEKACACQARPCRIVEHSVVWRSLPIRQRRLEKRRVGKECVRTGRSRMGPYR